ncbi:cytochrome P450 [Microbacterium hydrocarbonoxydans]|uniref:cytochrome P450 n=1 Tax=Microbacterium hydrocarbonoxydans TaxID=273678 RepID=UPI0007BBD042|nr:cytochrome P450 [Microbacterium hydrocarbonoxydans]GAT74660.1 cytochrome P450 [Microbacterium sp. HM58-2]
MRTVPYLDLADTAFDVNSEEVHTARDDSWYAETPYGWAVLRYEEGTAVLKDRRFQQGNARWPAQNGIHDGPWQQWWAETLLSLEGDDHLRLRKLLGPAFRSGAIARMRPQFQALANELIDSFASRGEVEFVSEFAEPYASRILCLLLGLPDDEWPQVAHWADDLGKSFGINVRHDLPRIEAALEGLTGYIEKVIADRAENPRDDLVTTLLHAHEEDDALDRRELSVALVFLAFAGMETTRNQLGLALQTLLRHPDQWALLAAEPDLGGRAVEEVMRVNPTVTWVTREAIEDVDLFGLAVPKGGIVQVLSHAVGTDPSKMGDEPGFDIRVEDRPLHSGFGGGVHHCLGHFVARTDMSVALPLLAQRMPDAEPAGPGEWLPVSGNTGPVRFPIRFTPER